MSAYVSVETAYKDQACLVAALREMGYDAEVHVEAVPLVGYHGDLRPQRAHVVIPRIQLGCAANDVGFERGADGSFKAHISQYDRSATFPAAKQQELRRRYAKAVTIKTAVAKGYRVVEEKQDGGRIKLRLRRYA